MEFPIPPSSDSPTMVNLMVLMDTLLLPIRQPPSNEWKAVIDKGRLEQMVLLQPHIQSELIQDYYYADRLGDLDSTRFCVTPEYPNGVHILLL